VQIIIDPGASMLLVPSPAQALLAKWMQKEKQILLFAFVLMPSHLHAILKPQRDIIGETLQRNTNIQAPVFMIRETVQLRMSVRS
jgi:hypothetical protein